MPAEDLNDDGGWDGDEWEEDEDEFDHFTEQQDIVWSTVLAELRAGRKRSHWMWYVFPVLDGVGKSTTALFYALRDKAEARAYLAHDVLGPRLIDCMELIATHEGTQATEILGDVDAYKLHNCATLFAAAADDPAPFVKVLKTHFDGAPAERTIHILRGQDE